MDFNDRVRTLTDKIRRQYAEIQTEEATKTAFIMPFIQTVLGYDVFDPMEVVPEYTADFDKKKAKKVDYVIRNNGEIQMLIECKKCGNGLSSADKSQLEQYFTVTNARIAVLTNGKEYRFFTDLDRPNLMDASPFMVFDFERVDETLLPKLKQLTKEDFDLDSVIGVAEELKYVGAIKRRLAEQFREPEDEWVRFLLQGIYSGSFTKKVREQFTPLVVKAAQQYLRDQVNDRLEFALGSGPGAEPGDEVATEPAETDDQNAGDQEPDDQDASPVIVTTDEELEGYRIVKAIACGEVTPDRVAGRDAKSYFAVLLDDNNRKPIARLHFNGKSRKYLGLFDADKVETRHPISTVEEIYGFADAIRQTVRNYDGPILATA